MEQRIIDKKEYQLETQQINYLKNYFNDFNHFNHLTKDIANIICTYLKNFCLPNWYYQDYRKFHDSEDKFLLIPITLNENRFVIFVFDDDVIGSYCLVSSYQYSEYSELRLRLKTRLSKENAEDFFQWYFEENENENRYWLDIYPQFDNHDYCQIFP